MVKSLLQKHATKSMSVSCRWIRSRNRSELVWMVGDRSRFNQEGVVPVNYTQKNIRHDEWENDWLHLPEIKALSAVAALLHDWGKAADHFQHKLRRQSLSKDPYRHEWISCRLISGLVALTGSADDDTAWLTRLSLGDFSADALAQAVNEGLRNKLRNLPPLAAMLCWLILSHHRLPVLQKDKCKKYYDLRSTSFSDMMSRIDAAWGYDNGAAHTNVTFSKGLLLESSAWRKALRKWVPRLLQEKDALIALMKKGDFRLVLLYSRLSLMLSDYFISSGKGEEDRQGNTELYANTYKGELKQRLDEHLVKVAGQAARIAHYLPVFSGGMASVKDVRSLRKRSPAPFRWQDTAVQKLIECQKQLKCGNKSVSGYFIVNMASTGCGKTFANAKLMQAISADHKTLRYNLLLGLRTLTLQTGEEYRNRIGLTADEMAVLIGSSAVRKLYDEERKRSDNGETSYLDEEESFAGVLNGIYPEKEPFLDIFFDQQKNKAAIKNKRLLYSPVLVSTIDHIMPATEATHGGKYMLPLLRLMSSDIVIDEIDDFGKQDLVAIARVVHLAGMLGHHVTISSATISPDLAEGLFSAYQEGQKCFAAFFGKDLNIVCAWCDEFRTQTRSIAVADITKAGNFYRQMHQTFVDKRVVRLSKELIKRKGYIVDCDPLKFLSEDELEQAYFEKIKQTVIDLHRRNSFTDKKTGKHVSCGVIGMNNIRPCVLLGDYLVRTAWPEQIAPRIMVYHSQQVLLLRHEQERYLDRVLKRKKPLAATVDIEDEVLRHHIDNAKEENVIFLVVATPIEAVGRDHDFDWAVIEPFSYRAIIQLIGRILRHRLLQQDIQHENIAILGYNLKGLKMEAGILRKGPAFDRPGFETAAYRLKSHTMNDLLDEAVLRRGIDATPRIQKDPTADPAYSLAALEHKVMEDFKDLSKNGPAYIHGWQEEVWWMTGMPQQINPFRAGRLQVEVCLCYSDGHLSFQEKDDKTGLFVPRGELYQIEICEPVNSDRFWLQRDYYQTLQANLSLTASDAVDEEKQLEKLCQQYGLLSFPDNAGNGDGYYYSDQYGLYRK